MMFQRAGSVQRDETGDRPRGDGVSAADLLTVEATPQTFDTQDMRNASKRYAEVGAPAFRDRLQFKDR